MGKGSVKAKEVAAQAGEDFHLRLEWLDPKQLDENPANWRLHPAAQTESIESVIGDPEVGWAGALLYNETTRRLIDGHARRKVPERLLVRGKVPVLVGRWSEEAEAKILATHDPLGALAVVDAKRIDALLAGVKGLPDPVDSLLRVASEGAQVAALVEAAGGAEGSRRLDTDPATVVTCVLPCPDVALVEKALSATGLMNRGEAFKTICEAYLAGKGGQS
jgi:hypothetical protein